MTKRKGKIRLAVKLGLNYKTMLILPSSNVLCDKQGTQDYSVLKITLGCYGHMVPLITHSAESEFFFHFFLRFRVFILQKYVNKFYVFDRISFKVTTGFLVFISWNVQVYRVFIFKCSSQEGAEEQMARNGGAQKRLTQILSTVRDTCTEAKTVQESLWKFWNQRQQQDTQILQPKFSPQSPKTTLHM